MFTGGAGFCLGIATGDVALGASVIVTSSPGPHGRQRAAASLSSLSSCSHGFSSESEASGVWVAELLCSARSLSSDGSKSIGIMDGLLR